MEAVVKRHKSTNVKGSNGERVYRHDGDICCSLNVDGYFLKAGGDKTEKCECVCYAKVGTAKCHHSKSSLPVIHKVGDVGIFVQLLM